MKDTELSAEEFFNMIKRHDVSRGIKFPLKEEVYNFTEKELIQFVSQIVDAVMNLDTAPEDHNDVMIQNHQAVAYEISEYFNERKNREKWQKKKQ